jgi:hypothetical protein
MPTATKTQIQAELDTALARIAELEAAQTDTPDARIEGNRLEQTVWLSKNSPSQSWSRGTTKSGTPFIKFGAQFAELDKPTGIRDFGAWKNYVAYGDTALQVEALYRGTDRLVHMVSFEKPSMGRGERANERYTEWVVTTFQPVPRMEAPAEDTAPAQAPAAEPTLDEIPF